MDYNKMFWLVEEAITKLQFLGVIKKEDDASSELAGYEINKLLTKQSELEQQYAQLLQIRTTLKGISNKRKLGEVEGQIKSVSEELKDSTKKLGRLFRENPDLASDAREIDKDRTDLIMKLDSLSALAQANSMVQIQQELISEMEEQDNLRKMIKWEKELTAQIKALHNDWKNENAEYQAEINEKQNSIQRQKEKLVKAETKAAIDAKYRKKELAAEAQKDTRIYQQTLNNLEQDKSNFEEKMKTEELVFKKIKEFTVQKEQEIIGEGNAWKIKLEKETEKKEKFIADETNKRDHLLKEIEKVEKKLAQAREFQEMKEKKEIEKEEEKKKKRAADDALEDAIKKIQEQYNAWKEAGGVIKKKKKKKKK